MDRAKLQMNLYKGFRNDVLDRLDMAIRVCCTTIRDSKSKLKQNLPFIKTLIDIDKHHKEKAIETELYYSKLIHAIQIVRYLKHSSGKFNRKYWNNTLRAMANAMMDEHKLLE